MSEKLQFRPVSHSWVAIHPNPQGIVQFIGGAFFGTFGPMLFYRSLLQSIFDAGYTIILMPFNFTFNHYVEAGFLIKEQYDIIPELVRIALRNRYEFEKYLADENYYWLGHSIGCKYISLLEGFSALPENSSERKEFIRDLIKQEIKVRRKGEVPEKCDQDSNDPICRLINTNTDIVSADIERLIEEVVQKYIKAFELVIYYLLEYYPSYIEQEFIKGKISEEEKNLRVREVKKNSNLLLQRVEKFKQKYFGQFSKSPRPPLTQYDLPTDQSETQITENALEIGDIIDTIFIKNQASILLAPVNSGTESAIPPFLAGIVDNLGLGVKPSSTLTYNLIRKGNFFDLLGLVSFNSDNLAKSTVTWFDETFKKPPVDPQGQLSFRDKLKGGHLRPLGLRVGGSVINFPDSFQVPFIESVESKKKIFESYVTQLLKYLEEKRIESNKS